MKPYTLCTYLLPLLLATVQATEQKLSGVGSSYQDTDNKNPNEQYPYIQEQQQDFEKWQQQTCFSMDDMQDPLEELYKNSVARPYQHIKQTPPLYFVYGPAGSGKSTLIYALQGNTIEIETDDLAEINIDDCDYEDIKTGELELTKTVNVPIPEVSEYSHQQEAVKIYYTGEKIKKSMAFCDTPDYVSIEKNLKHGENPYNYYNKGKRFVKAYTPYFVLKNNIINGIVFVLSETDFRLGGPIPSQINHLVEHYFEKDVLSKDKEALKKSIILVINRIQKSDKKAFGNLYKFIFDSIKAYNNQFNLRDNYSHPKSLLALFLNDNNAIDLKNVHCFHPYDPKNVQQLRKKLDNLKPIDPKLFKYKQPKDLVNQYKPKPKPSPKQKSPSPVIYQTSTQETNVEDEVSIQPGQQDNLNNPSQQQQNDLQNIKDPIQKPVIDPLEKQVEELVQCLGDERIEELRKDRVQELGQETTREEIIEELKHHIRQELLQQEELKRKVGGGLDNQDNPSNPSQQHTQQDIHGNQSEDDSNNLSDTQKEEHNSTTIPKPPSPDIEDKTQDDSNNLSDTQEEEHNSTTIPKPPLPDIDQNKNLYKNLGIAGVLAISTVGLLYLMNKNSSTKQKKSKKSSDLPTNQVAENLQQEQPSSTS